MECLHLQKWIIREIYTISEKYQLIKIKEIQGASVLAKYEVLQ